VEENTMILNQYELIYVAKPQLTAADLEGLSTKVTGFIERAEGQVLAVEEWGRKRLAYPIAKNEHGVFSYVNFVAPPEAPISIERGIGLDDSFMRYITVQLTKNVDVDLARTTAETHKAERDAVRAAEDEAERVAAEADAAMVAAAEAAKAAKAAAAAADTAAAEAAASATASATEEEATVEAAPAEAAPAEKAAAEAAPAEEAAAEDTTEDAAEDA
jgi:small subunit ribosomal protein S6